MGLQFSGRCDCSGTVGTGCLLELNGTNKLNNPNYNEIYKRRDLVEMSIGAWSNIK